jgi:outer membrane protein assembly factor BamB
MYVTAADRVVALRPETGEEVWRYAMTERSPSRRGVTYWSGEGGTPPRLFVTAGSVLLALDAGLGTPVTEFGANGVVQMPVRYDAAPTLFENLLIVGSNSPPGSARAFDARSGAQVWEFLSIPGTGEFGNDTWDDDGWVENSGALHWPFSMTVDVERRTLYSVFDSPAPFDYYGGDRSGANLFGNSLVALDVDTGRRKWHFQAVHHDIWDYDLPSPPGLLDVTIGGESVPALAIAGKTGSLYLLNRHRRTTGAGQRRTGGGVLADAADSGQTAADRAYHVHRRRGRHGRRHQRRARGVLPEPGAAQRRAAELGFVHALCLLGARSTATVDDAVSRLRWRRELGWRRRRSDIGLRIRQYHGRSKHGLGRAEPIGIAAALST